MAGTCDLKGTAHYNKIESDPFEWRRQAEVREARQFYSIIISANQLLGRNIRFHCLIHSYLWGIVGGKKSEVLARDVSNSLNYIRAVGLLDFLL